MSVAAVLLLASCGEDRSGEQPIAPTVENAGYEQTADSVVLTGRVTASPNSSLRECGFEYGNDTLSLTATAAVAAEVFTATTDSLGKGTYYAVAYARNGVGKSYAADTIRFTLE